jgi:uncharacterized protein (UPF0332 family)
LDAGDLDGTCNRAYYAMFDAARAALLSSPTPEAAVAAKTHRGLIAAFGMHLVKTGVFPVRLGKALNRAEEIRLIADYTGDTVESGEAKELVSLAEIFVAEVQKQLHHKLSE